MARNRLMNWGTWLQHTVLLSAFPILRFSTLPKPNLVDLHHEIEAVKLFLLKKHHRMTHPAVKFCLRVTSGCGATIGNVSMSKQYSPGMERNVVQAPQGECR